MFLMNLGDATLRKQLNNDQICVTQTENGGYDVKWFVTFDVC